MDVAEGLLVLVLVLLLLLLLWLVLCLLWLDGVAVQATAPH